MVPADAEYHIYCNSPEKGASKRSICKAGCLGCRKCEKLFGDRFKVSGSLAEVNYDNDAAVDADIAEAIGCPTGCLLSAADRLEAAYLKVKGEKR